MVLIAWLATILPGTPRLAGRADGVALSYE
jgi:hypothetical protein